MMSSSATMTESDSDVEGFSAEQLAAFRRDGFAIVRGLADVDWIDRMRTVTREHLERELPPVEFEAEVHYPGSPDSLDSPGGHTVRRLKQALSRDIVFTEWVSRPDIVTRLEQLLGDRVYMPLAHHNCVMTKQPAYSSDTGWHQDARYWSFTKPELVSVWLALGTEMPRNGCLWVIPGSHRMSMDRSRFDDLLFFRADHPENKPLIADAVPVELDPGDVLFFHAKTLHAASRNHTDVPKFSVVFTFRGADNPPLAGSRSAASGELLLPSPSRASTVN